VNDAATFGSGLAGLAGLVWSAAAGTAALRRSGPYLPAGHAIAGPRLADPLPGALRLGLGGLTVPVTPGPHGELFLGPGAPQPEYPPPDLASRAPERRPREVQSAGPEAPPEGRKEPPPARKPEPELDPDFAIPFPEPGEADKKTEARAAASSAPRPPQTEPKAEDLAAFRAILDRVNERRAELAAFLARASILSLSAGEMRLGWEPGDMFGHGANDKDSQELVTTFATEHFGVPTKVVF